MAREEEITFEAQKHGLNCMSRINYQNGFIHGAKWADKTMIEKACEWLLKNTYKHVDDSRVYMTFTYTVDMIEDFRRTLLE